MCPRSVVGAARRRLRHDRARTLKLRGTARRTADWLLSHAVALEYSDQLPRVATMHEPAAPAAPSAAPAPAAPATQELRRAVEALAGALGLPDDPDTEAMVRASALHPFQDPRPAPPPPRRRRARPRRLQLSARAPRCRSCARAPRRLDRSSRLAAARAAARARAAVRARARARARTARGTRPASACKTFPLVSTQACAAPPRPRPVRRGGSGGGAAPRRVFERGFFGL